MTSYPCEVIPKQQYTSQFAVTDYKIPFKFQGLAEISNQNRLLIADSLSDLSHIELCFGVCHLVVESDQIIRIRRDVDLNIFTFLVFVLFAFYFLFLLIDSLHFLRRVSRVLILLFGLFGRTNCFSFRLVLFVCMLEESVLFDEMNCRCIQVNCFFNLRFLMDFLKKELFFLED